MVDGSENEPKKRNRNPRENEIKYLTSPLQYELLNPRSHNSFRSEERENVFFRQFKHHEDFHVDHVVSAPSTEALIRGYCCPSERNESQLGFRVLNRSRRSQAEVVSRRGESREPSQVEDETVSV